MSDTKAPPESMTAAQLPALGRPILGARYQNDGLALLYLDPLQTRTRKEVESKIADGRYLFERVPCALCGSVKMETLCEKDRCGLLTHVVACINCGLAQTNPRMTEESYRQYYQSEYRILQDNASSPEEAFARERNRGRQIIEFLSQSALLPRSARPSVVEIGCGAGGILSVFSQRGFRAVGVDIASERLTYAKQKYGFELAGGTLATADLTLTSPDVVLYSHSLEHMLHLDAELASLRGVIGRETLVYIEVPGIKRLDLYEDDFLLYVQNAHVYHFSLETLTALMEKHGFERVMGDETIRSVFRLRSGDAPFCARNDYLSLHHALAQAELRRSRFHFRSTLRSAAGRLGLLPVMRRARATARVLLS